MKKHGCSGGQPGSQSVEYLFVENELVKSAANIGRPNRYPLNALHSDPHGVIRQRDWCRPRVLVHRKQLGSPLLSLNACYDDVAACDHPFHFAELFLAKELKDVLNNPQTETGTLA